MPKISQAYLLKADGSIDSFMRVGVPILAQQLFNMTRSISSPYPRFIGSAFLSTPKTLDMRFLVTLLGEVRYSLLVALTRIRR